MRGGGELADRMLALGVDFVIDVTTREYLVPQLRRNRRWWVFGGVCP